MSVHWPLGTIVHFAYLQKGLSFCKTCELDTFQLRLGDARQHNCSSLAKMRRQFTDLRPLTCMAGWPGPAVWDFRHGYQTLGIGPEDWREVRMDALKAGIEAASELEIPLVQTHLGFIPEDPSCDEYVIFVEALQTLGRLASQKGVVFCLETGQETPITLRRIIEDAGEKAVGINFDPANLLMYGKGNPVDAVPLLGKYILSLHIKDGCYPGEDSYQLGEEKSVGDGDVNFPVLFSRLAEIGFQGPLIIEREIPEPAQSEEIHKSIPLLRSWIAQVQSEECKP